MKDLRKLIGLLIVIAIFGYGLYEPLLNFFTWLILLNYTPSSISFVGDVFVRVATFAISFTVIGKMFSQMGWFDRGIMRVAYFLTSTIVSCLLDWLVMTFETHIETILIAIIILFVAIGIWWGIKRFRQRTVVDKYTLNMPKRKEGASG